MNDSSLALVIGPRQRVPSPIRSSGEGVLLALALMTLLAGILFGYPFWHVRYSGIPLTLDRMLWIGVVLGLVVVMLRRGFALREMTRGDIFLVVFITYLGISATIAAVGENDSASVARWIFFYFIPATLYFSVRQTQISESVQRVILIGIGCVGIYLALTGVAEVFGFGFLVFPSYILDQSISGEFLGRARGPLLNPIVNGFLMTIAWAAWIVLSRSAPRRWWPILLLAHAVMAVGVVSTLTRSVWMGTCLSGLFLGYNLLPQRYRWAWLATGAFVVILIALLVKGLFWEMKRDRDLSAAEAARSAQLRPILAQLAWEMTKDHPFFGVGLAQYDRAKEGYLSNPLASYPVNQAKPYTQHNVFLSVLAETGAVGLTVFMFLLAAWGRDVALRHREGNQNLCLLGIVALASYITNGLFHDVTIIPQMNAVLFTVLGLAQSVPRDPAAS